MNLFIHVIPSCLSCIVFAQQAPPSPLPFKVLKNFTVNIIARIGVYEWLY